MKATAKLPVALMILSGAIFWTVKYLPLTTNGALQHKALLRREIALRVLGEYVATEFSGNKALIVSNPFTQRASQSQEIRAFEEAGIRGLKKGWGQKIQLEGIGFPELHPAAMAHPSTVPVDPQTTTPLSFLTTEDAWDNLLQKYPDTDLVVSLIGLPATLRNLEIWRQPKPHFALLLPDLRMIGNGTDVKEAFRSGKLVAMILEKPGAPPDSASAARDYRTEFNRRFVLVTARNFGELLEGPKKVARR